MVRPTERMTDTRIITTQPAAPPRGRTRTGLIVARFRSSDHDDDRGRRLSTEAESSVKTTELKSGSRQPYDE